MSTYEIVPPCFSQVNLSPSAERAEAHWRAVCAVLASGVALTDATRKELVERAIEARSWIPAARLAELDAGRLHRAQQPEPLPAAADAGQWSVLLDARQHDGHPWPLRTIEVQREGQPVLRLALLPCPDPDRPEASARERQLLQTVLRFLEGLEPIAPSLRVLTAGWMGRTDRPGSAG